MTGKTSITEVVQVCIPKTKRDYYDYCPGTVKPEIGARVLVPFQKRLRAGLVVGVGQSKLSPGRLKTIDSVIDTSALLSAENLSLIRWVAAYYQAPLSEVLALVLPKRIREGQALSLPQQRYYQLACPLEQAITEIRKGAVKQKTLLERLAHSPEGMDELELKKIISKTALEGLLQKNLIHERLQLKVPAPFPGEKSVPLALNTEQQQAVEVISAALSKFQCFLLQGVTGSGKTEVYLQVIAKVLANGFQALVLVPEIGLTPQLIERFRQRFNVPMAVIHSRLNERERTEAWTLARAGILRLIIGTRTAVFTPMPELGLLVIDEEHDASLKQMDGVRYSARDTALMRAKQGGFPVVLGSATPSLESLRNALDTKYQHLLLQNKAMQSQPLHYRLIDIRNTRLQEGLADQTLQQMAKHLEAGNQVLVFINRRGFAPVVLCYHCGSMLDCRDCDSHMTLHRPQNRLRCHHCGRSERMPERCEKCHGTDLIAVGTGTQRLEQFLGQYFPQYPLLRIDRDEVAHKDAFDRHLQRIAAGEAQLIIGTQMLAKGHHFPNLTLAVILDTDAALTQADFRATERLGQLLLQVAGRAGRAEKAGEVLIQTHQPQHPLLNQLLQYGYTEFAQSLLQARKQAALPPWHYLALFRARDRNYPRLYEFMQNIKQYLRTSTLQIMGPAPAPLARKAGEHQLHLLIKSSTRRELHCTLTALRNWLTINKLASQIHWSVDVDPQELA